MPDLPNKHLSSTALQHHITDIAVQHEQDDARAHILIDLKETVEVFREHSKSSLLKDNNGEACAKNLSAFQDRLISALYAFIAEQTNEQSGQTVPGDDQALITVIATGGYGRGLLAPQSDIDLLFLMPDKADERNTVILEYILYMLWDLGFKVGHATRKLEECISEAKADMTICTAMLDSRLVTGSEKTFDHYMMRFIKDVVTGNSRNFVQAKFEERNLRHERSGDTRYQVEPNLKEDKGGMRDLHLLHWLSTYISFDKSIKPSTNDKTCFVTLVNEVEADAIRQCDRFLWTTRCHLHFLRGKPDERLSFDIQLPMAGLMGYSGDEGQMQAAENFMRDYFLNAREVGDLTRVICSALEVRHLKAQPMLKRVFARLKTLSAKASKATSDKVSNNTADLPEEFVYEHGRLNVVSEAVLKEHPVNLIRIFSVAAQSGSYFHPEAYRLLRENLDLINDDVRNDPEANRLLLEILMSPDYVEGTLRRMTDSGVLGRFIEEFGKIDCMMQFNMYHHYTVDDHLIRAVGLLAALDRGEMAEDHPLSHRLMQKVNKRVLYVAVLLHDIAKGQKEDHSIAGAKVAKTLCPRLGLNRSETATVAWLVENHLEMSTFAQSRDISDRKTLSDFTNIVQKRSRLDLLLILTVVDIKAVGPDTWNGWKGQLLRNLYYAVEPQMAGRVSTLSGQEAVEKSRMNLAKALEKEGWAAEAIQEVIERYTTLYWLKTPAEQQMRHAKLIAKAQKAKEGSTSLHSSVRIKAFTDSTEMTFYRVSHPFHLMTITASCAAVGANITGAQISTTRDGMALDDIVLQRSFELDEDEMRRADNIVKLITQTVSGEKSLGDIKKVIRPPKGRISAFNVTPTVRIDNTLSDRFTVIEIEGLDRYGLLFEIASAMYDLNIDIHSAHIATFGEKIVDVFYVTDLTNSKITSESRIRKSEQQLLEAVSFVEQEETESTQ